MPITLVLADDHEVVRHGLRAILQAEPDFKLVGESGDGIETLRLVEKLKPDVLVLDLMMPNLGGLQVLEQLGQRSPRTRTLILSMQNNEAYVVQALRMGAAGFVTKDARSEELIKGIREAAVGKTYLSTPLSEQALRSYDAATPAKELDPYETLTSREREVLHLAVEGQSSSEIARRLFISPRTVESHRANLMRKLNVRNQTELVRYVLHREARSGPSQP